MMGKMLTADTLMLPFDIVGFGMVILGHAFNKVYAIASTVEND